jgi:ATP-dependent DNA ligase
MIVPDHGQCEFAEWTPDNHLRHSRFIALRADNDAKQVIKEDKVV